MNLNLRWSEKNENLPSQSLHWTRHDRRHFVNMYYHPCPGPSPHIYEHTHCFSEQTSNTLNTSQCGFPWKFGEQVCLTARQLVSLTMARLCGQNQTYSRGDREKRV